MGIALYEISQQYRDVLNWDIENEPDAAALCDLLGEIEERFEKKAGAVIAFVRNIDAEAEAFRTEEKRLAEIRKHLERKSERLREYLDFEMRRCDFVELDAGLAKLKYVKTPWSVEVADGAEIPQEYLRVKIEADKTKLKEAMQAGEQFEGVRLVQGERLRIS
jgi:hypothetical protein